MIKKLSILIGILGAASPLAAQPAKRIEFNRDIRPILSEYCYNCHGPAKSTRKGDLRLDTKDGAMTVIAPGKLKGSLLYQRITSLDVRERMPPAKTGKKLNERQIELVKRWIEQGAPWQEHWAFIAPKRPDLPYVKNAKWVRNPIDRFILARLEKEGITPSPEADPRTLIRRVTQDLTGLPPTVKEVDDFVTAWDAAGTKREQVWGGVVDRLLNSPRYGERMVLEWLDAARYSDTNGYQTDGTRAMWPWRDWVINALNKNMPFDQFTIEQIAGDMLPKPTISQKIATGFHRNHMLNGEGGRIAEESRVDYVVDRVDTTGAVWLGLTVGCGRCHDHKYDPISQKEYYQLFAYWNSIAEVGGVDRRNGTGAPILELPTPEQQEKIAKIEKNIRDRQSSFSAREKVLLADLTASGKKLPDKKSPEYSRLLARHPRFKDLQKLKTALDAERKKLAAAKNGILITMIMEERKDPRETFILERGIYNKYGARVQAGIPKVFPPIPKDAPNNRLGLAKWLVSKENPLTARVTVNRLWQQYFGIGLVKTSEDFGVQGELPSHPELLDWLAVEFMAPTSPRRKPGDEENPTLARGAGWNMKHIHRLIVTSATYRQSSKVTPVMIERDPDNRLLAHSPRLRHSPFQLRDQALALSGLLVEKIGGPPVRPYQPPGLWEDFSFNQIKYVQDKGDKLYRRSLYTFWRRSIGPPNMFDTPNRQVCTVRQARTNTPLHALILMNDVTFVEASRVWAERLMKDHKTPETRLAFAWRQATARPPTATEQKVLLAGYQRVLKQYQADPKAAEKLVSMGESPRDKTLDVAEHAALAAMANMILNLDEVITKE
ncbi:MAG: PSD1 domain-containing protein [Planctomycetes bacterium]|nr:PSD1 domain-containing protein [Planctomycetota bacterium]